jgi:hypothetical protein
LPTGIRSESILDYGCGRGDDADRFGWDKYDPHYFPKKPYDKEYDIIVCQYVLNVIEDENERKKVIRDVLNFLHSEGTAFFIVRDDLISLGGCTSKGTWQGLVNLDKYMRIWTHKKGKYKIYYFCFQYYEKLKGYLG